MKYAEEITQNCENKCLLIPNSLNSFLGQHLKDMNDPIMEGVLMETENMLARGRMDLPVNLCFATLRGDDLLLHQLLKRGLDPNESDNNGRTALVRENFFSFNLVNTPASLGVGANP